MFKRSVVRFLSALLVLGSLCITSFSQAVRTQTLSLNPGWNAVFLEVDPLTSEIESVIGDAPIDKVAAYVLPRSGAQFIADPTVDMSEAYGWSVWYSPERSDSFLSTLYGLKGNQGYLVHALTQTVLAVEGTVSSIPLRWEADSFNFVGFTVQSPGAPTFEQFFGASPAHNHNKIYRMVQGKWRQVLDPGAETLRSGEAFWIYSEGASSYTGPLRVETPSVIGLTLNVEAGADLIFRNETDHPISFTLEHIPENNTSIPMAGIIRGVDEDTLQIRDITIPFGHGPWIQDFPPLEAESGIKLPIRLISSDVEPGISHSLLRVRSDLGTEVYLSVNAYLEEVE